MSTTAMVFTKPVSDYDKKNISKEDIKEINKQFNISNEDLKQILLDKLEAEYKLGGISDFEYRTNKSFLENYSESLKKEEPAKGVCFSTTA